MTKKKWLFFSVFVGIIACFGLVNGKRALPIVLQALPFPSTVIGPPKGYVWADPKSTCYTPLNVAHTLLFTPFPLSQKPSTIYFPETFVLTLEKGRVYGRNGVVITGNDEILANTAVEWISDIKEHSIFCKNKLPQLQVLDVKIATIASKSGNCYFHWMCDILPRLELLKRSGIAYDYIYLNPLEHPFQKESVELLKLDPEKIIYADKQQHIEAKTLIVPSMPACHSGHVPNWAIDFLRETFLPKTLPAHDQKIYISRKKAATRKVLNEEALLGELGKLGFKEVVLEELTVQQQAALFASATCIVAPHGAGLTNLVFSQDATVVEIFSPAYINPCYFRISHQRGLDYHCLLGTEKTENHDIEVDINKIIEIANNSVHR